MKKSQISIFAIIAIILLVIGIFLIFNSKYEFFTSYENKLKNQVSEVVKSCIYDEGERGAFLLGFQGGYIDVPLDVKLNPKKHIDLGFKFPNWDSESGNIPTIDTMQKELNVFLSSSVYSCVETGLKSLEENLIIDIGEDMIVDAVINKESVEISASLPINFKEKNKDEEITIEDFYVKIEELRLGDMYDLAVEIYNLEAQSNFFEELTLEQMYSASDYSSAEAMPTEGMSFACIKRVWTKDQLKRNLANLNNHNFKYLQFQGTYPKSEIFDANLNKDLGTYDYRSYFLSPNVGYVQRLEEQRKSYKNYEVDVMMPSTEVTGKNSYLKRYPFREFEVTPSSGQVVKSMDLEIDLGAKVPIPCIQIYHHLYSLDYDLMIKLTDKNEDGLNYFFQFPLRVKIENNNPKVKLPSIIPSSDSTYNVDNFCSDDGLKYPMKIFVKDSTNDELLNDAQISYKCISLTCELGETQVLTYKGYEYGNNAFFEGNFPYCVGGKVIAEKEGYHKGELKVERTDESLLNSPNVVYYDIELTPKISFKVDKKSFLIVETETGKGRSVVTENDGFVYAMIENKDHDFTSEVFWPNEGNYLDTMDFLDDENVVYNLSLIYVDKDYNLKGILEQDNWKPDLNEIKGAREIRINIPGSINSIEEDSFIQFYELSKDLATAQFNPYYVDFGISFR
ncbi:MAG: hypothetical protein KC550_00745 [Nanoarchaeota archaeon]|nr:hypothetical protein [Nanoarchaeota archaeon]